MKVLIEAPFNLTPNERKEIEQLVNKLSVYEEKITQADVFFKLDDGTESGVVLAEIQIHVPGPEVFASDTNQSYSKAFSSALQKAKMQLIKRKEIRQRHAN